MTEDHELSARFASWLSFLRAARQVTLQSLAVGHGTQRSNLSALITSKGRVRNVSLDKIRSVLFELGALADGSLAPGLHRWTVPGTKIDEMRSFLKYRGFEHAMVFCLGSGYGAYAVVRVSQNIVVFAFLPADGVVSVGDSAAEMLSFGEQKIHVVQLDRAGDAQIQALWMTPDDSVVESKLRELIG